VRKREDLPLNAQHYLDRIEAVVGIPVVLVSVGRERSHTIVLHDLF
jgi:adenylosuccinate synthase